MRTSADVRFDLRYDDTDAPVVTVDIVTPIGTVAIMADIEVYGRTLRLIGFHAEAQLPNRFGPTRLRVLAELALDLLEDYDVIEIEGATRTTGANPGRKPHPLRFTRRARPASG